MDSKKKSVLDGFPPGLGRKTLLKIPARQRDDAAQIAWLACLEGEDPELAVWAFVRREARHAERFVPFSQLPRAQRRRLRTMLGM